MQHDLADLIADLFNIPSWAPRAAQRLALWIIVVVMVAFPTVYRDAIDIWVQRQVQSIMARMEPFLHPPKPITHQPVPTGTSHQGKPGVR